MIEIEAYTAWDTYHVRANGHANYAPEGQDVVCAGVSAILDSLAVYVHNTFHANGVEDSRESGRYSLSWTGDDASGQVYKAAMLGLMCIANQFPEHVRVSCSLGGI